eukprot:6203029-Pleurochrysis_carterae.AAC.2
MLRRRSASAHGSNGGRSWIPRTFAQIETAVRVTVCLISASVLRGGGGGGRGHGFVSEAREMSTATERKRSDGHATAQPM